MGHQVKHANISDMAQERAPVHVAKSDLRDNSIAARPSSPRSEAVVSPRHALRPTTKPLSPRSASPPVTSPTHLSVPSAGSPPSLPPMPAYNETLRGDIGEECSN